VVSKNFLPFMNESKILLQEKRTISYRHIIPLSNFEKIYSCFGYCSIKNKLTKEEYNNFVVLQNKFSESFFDEPENTQNIYDSVKKLANQVFINDIEYYELMSRKNEEEKRRKLLNYMGFLFGECYYDVLGVGCIIEEILSESINHFDFIKEIRNMVNNQIIPFGQTFGKLVYKIKLFLYLDNDKNFENKYSKKRIKRKQLKNLAKYLLNDKTFCKFYRIIFELFIWISEEFRKQYSQNRSRINSIIDNIIEKAIDILDFALLNTLTRDFSMTQFLVENKSKLIPFDN
jgi:hypothetical protein